MRKHEDIIIFVVIHWFKMIQVFFAWMFLDVPSKRTAWGPYQAHHVMHPGLPTTTRTKICNMIRCGPVTETTSSSLHRASDRLWPGRNCKSKLGMWLSKYCLRTAPTAAAECGLALRSWDIGEFTAHSHNDINWLGDGYWMRMAGEGPLGG